MLNFPSGLGAGRKGAHTAVLGAGKVLRMC